MPASESVGARAGRKLLVGRGFAPGGATAPRGARRAKDNASIGSTQSSGPFSSCLATRERFTLVGFRAALRGRASDLAVSEPGAALFVRGELLSPLPVPIYFTSSLRLGLLAFSAPLAVGQRHRFIELPGAAARLLLAGSQGGLVADSGSIRRGCCRRVSALLCHH